MCAGRKHVRLRQPLLTVLLFLLLSTTIINIAIIVITTTTTTTTTTDIRTNQSVPEGKGDGDKGDAKGQELRVLGARCPPTSP